VGEGLSSPASVAHGDPCVPVQRTVAFARPLLGAPLGVTPSLLLPRLLAADAQSGSLRGS